MTTPVHPNPPISTVDAVVFTIEEDALKLLLYCRDNEPFKGAWALPGGFIRTDEDMSAEGAMRRVLNDKTGVSGFYLEQLATYSGPERDPRGWSLSITHLALVPRDALQLLEDGSARLFPVDELPDLAFDHQDIALDALSRLRGKGAYSTLPAALLGEEFTLPEIQRAYELALDTTLDHSSFRRKVLDLGIIEETGENRGGPRKRPAKIYRLKEAAQTFNRTLG